MLFSHPGAQRFIGSGALSFYTALYFPGHAVSPLALPCPLNPQPCSLINEVAVKGIRSPL